MKNAIALLTAGTRLLGSGRKAGKKILSLDHEGLLDEILNLTLIEAVDPWDATNSKHALCANSTMSGLGHPCESVGCRVREAEKMARYAALYAGHLVLQSPFSEYFNLLRSEKSFMFMSSQIERIKARLIGDLAVLKVFEPLLRAGIATFAPRPTHICQRCLEHALEAKLDDVERDFTKLKKDIAESVAQTFEISVRMVNKRFYIEHISDDSPCGGSSMYVRRLLKLKRRKLVVGELYKLTPGEAASSMIIRSLANHSADDLFLQDIYTRKAGGSYVTNKAFELLVATRFAPRRAVDRVKSKLDAMEYSVPILENIEIADVVKLRMREPEAFAVYRDRMDEIDKSESAKNNLSEAYSDLIRPELHKIELQVKNAKKVLRAELTRDIVYASGAITGALYGGFIKETAVAAAGLVGGFKFASDVLRKASQLREDPATSRNEKFFFLYKLANK